MPTLEQLSSPPIETIYGKTPANGVIEFEQAEIRCVFGEHSCQGLATATLRLAPRATLRWRLPITEKSALEMRHIAFSHEGTVVVNLLTRNSHFEGFVSSVDNQGIELAPQCSIVTVTQQSHRIARAVFHLFNFPDFIGPNDYDLISGTPPFVNHQRRGRLVFKANGWLITIAANDLTDERSKELKSRGGLAITHMGEVQRVDGAEFTDDELNDILSCLHYFLSFATGRWAGVALPIGFDAMGNRVYEQWGLGITADGVWNESSSWFDRHHGELLEEVFPGFLRLWSNTIWRQPIAHALYWYLGASDVRGGIGVDTGLILAQTALEGLAWNYCIMDRKLVSKNAFERGGLNAANKLRLLATSLEIPTIHSDLMKSLSVRKGQKSEDALDAITSIRNRLVHSDSSSPLDASSIWHAWRFSLWLIDLIILRLCGHQGKYANRVARRYVGVVHDVPWAKQTTAE